MPFTLISYYLFTLFSYTSHTLLFCRKIKSCCDHCFPQQIRQQTIAELHILRDYSGVRIGFNMNNKHHRLPIVYMHDVSLNALGFNCYCLTELNEVCGNHAGPILESKGMCAIFQKNG